MLVQAKTIFAMSLDFVDTPLKDVVRAMSLAYNTPILVDDGIIDKVTFHLDGVDLLGGLDALCSAQHLEMYQDGDVVHIRKKVERGLHEFTMKDSLVEVSVHNKDVVEFAREYALNSGLNILVEPSVSGKISGELKNLPARDCFVKLLSVAGYRVRSDGDILVVQTKTHKPENDAHEKIQLEKMDSLYVANFRGAPLGEILQQLADMSKLDLAVYGELRETIQMKFDGVSLGTLLESLFKGQRYSYVLDSNRLFVSEGGARKALSSVKLYPLKHMNSERALTYLGKMAPSSEFVATEVKEQNALLMAGSPTEISLAEKLLQQVDLPAIQVTLSCIIVEFKRGKGFEIGVRGGSGRKTGEYNVGAKGFLDFLVSGAFGKIGLLPDRFELELASMEEQNKAEVLARPRLTTLNGSKAELNVTNTVYYLVSQVSADGFPITDYRSFNDGISLEITPSVTLDGSITLDVSPEIKTAGRSSGDGPRDISTRNLKTVVTLKNGETLCLGGLIRKNKSEVRSAVPFLGSIPFIGRLFSYVSEEEEENELAVFITPVLSN